MFFKYTQSTFVNKSLIVFVFVQEPCLEIRLHCWAHAFKNISSKHQEQTKIILSFLFGEGYWKTVLAIVSFFFYQNNMGMF